MTNPHKIVVLLVDDQPIIGESMRQMLRTEPEIAFHFCSEAHRALSTALEVSPTVILQDLVMSDVDGLDLVRQLRAEPATRDIPLIVLSVKEEPEVKAECFRLGANDYLVKLPSSLELIARIRYHSTAYINACQTRMAYEALRESREQLRLRNEEIRRQRDTLVRQAEQLRAANEELERMARVDPLTQLFNRRAFLERAREEQERFRRSGHAFALVLSDVDHFKRFNDTYGHACGDAVLRLVADTLRGFVRKQDVVARWGGEEFILLLPETAGEAGAQAAEKLRGLVAGARLEYEGHSLSVTMSFGVCEAGAAPTFDECVAHADAALYEAKAAGRNRVVLWKPKPHD